MNENKESVLERYHRYLEASYEGGSAKFFAPTGFLKAFETRVKVEAVQAKKKLYANSMDEATSALRLVADGQEGVFDLQAAPGTGKTSVLPFRFLENRVLVALPTQFDAYSAYQMATGKCALRFEKFSAGPSDAKVVYADSYYAARAVLSGDFPYDILIVDECDSPRGVTRFLAEVRGTCKAVIRMSATYGKQGMLTNRSFRVTEDTSMPNPAKSVSETASFVTANHKRRSLLLAPDADTATALAEKLPEAALVTSRSPLGELAKVMGDQQGSRLFVSDDVCARGLNLNLDALFDCQMVTEYGVTRTVTADELVQRKGRVGRSKPGFYFSPGLSTTAKAENDLDVVRNNVLRAATSVPQAGDTRLHMTSAEAQLLMCSKTEPCFALTAMRSKRSSSPEEVKIGDSSSSDGGKSVKSGASALGTPGRVSHEVPGWLFAIGGASPSGAKAYTARSGGRLVLASRRSSSSSGGDGGGKAAPARSGQHSFSLFPRQPDSGTVSRRDGYAGRRGALLSGSDAPYAVNRASAGSVPRLPAELPVAQPLMDLSRLEYDMDWPAVLTDLVRSGGDLPVMVPPHHWRHTSVGGLQASFFSRLDALAVNPDLSFTDDDLEVVARAWNLVAAARWSRGVRHSTSVKEQDRLEFCLRFFRSYFDLASAGY